MRSFLSWLFIALALAMPRVIEAQTPTQLHGHHGVLHLRCVRSQAAFRTHLLRADSPPRQAWKNGQTAYFHRTVRRARGIDSGALRKHGLRLNLDKSAGVRTHRSAVERRGPRFAPN